jgi:hypothetical protein
MPLVSGWPAKAGDRESKGWLIFFPRNQIDPVAVELVWDP